MAHGETNMTMGPDAAAPDGGPARRPRGSTDNSPAPATGDDPTEEAPLVPDNDPPGLPLAVILLDVEQPYAERSAMAGDTPPPLVRPSAYDARAVWAGQDIPVGSSAGPRTAVYAGGPKALGEQHRDAWESWWKQNHGLTVSTAGWVVYRHWDPKRGAGTLTPTYVVVEVPCLTIGGKLARVRAVTPPVCWRMSSELTIEKRSRRLVPANPTPAAEAEAGPDGFAVRWRKWKAARE